MNQHSLAETRGSNQIFPLPLAPSELDNKTHSEKLKQDVLYLHNSLEEVNSPYTGYQRQNNLKLEGMNEAVSNFTQSQLGRKRSGCYGQDRKASNSPSGDQVQKKPKASRGKLAQILGCVS